MKHIGGEVLRFLPIADPTRDERVDAVEIRFVQLGETAAIFLSRLDQQPLVHVSTLSTYRRWERLRGQVCTFTLFLQAVENESHLSVGLL